MAKANGSASGRRRRRRNIVAIMLRMTDAWVAERFGVAHPARTVAALDGLQVRPTSRPADFWTARLMRLGVEPTPRSRVLFLRFVRRPCRLYR